MWEKWHTSAQCRLLERLRRKKKIYTDKRDILLKEPLHDHEMTEKNGKHKHWRLVEDVRIKYKWNKCPGRNH